MENAKPILKRKTPLRSVVIILIIAVVVVLGIECYREWKNYERTARNDSIYYLVGVFMLSGAWETWSTSVTESPIDIQAMADDLKLTPPPNPYRRDHKTVFTTIDKRIPGAVFYIPGPPEDPYSSAKGIFCSGRDQGFDVMSKGDGPWAIGWELSQQDGIADGVAQLVSFGSSFPDMGPLNNYSWLWTRMWSGKFYWRYSDGTIVEPYEDRFISMFEDYHKRHPENFSAEKRPRMPKGFTISKEEARRAYFPEFVGAYYKKLYGYDQVVGDEKAKK